MPNFFSYKKQCNNVSSVQYVKTLHNAVKVLKGKCLEEAQRQESLSTTNPYDFDKEPFYKAVKALDDALIENNVDRLEKKIVNALSICSYPIGQTFSGDERIFGVANVCACKTKEGKDALQFLLSQKKVKKLLQKNNILSPAYKKFCEKYGQEQAPSDNCFEKMLTNFMSSQEVGNPRDTQNAKQFPSSLEKSKSGEKQPNGTSCSKNVFEKLKSVIPSINQAKSSNKSNFKKKPRK